MSRHGRTPETCGKRRDDTPANVRDPAAAEGPRAALWVAVSITRLPITGHHLPCWPKVESS